MKLKASTIKLFMNVINSVVLLATVIFCFYIKLLTLVKTLAHCGQEFIMAVKSLIKQVPEL